MAVLCLFCRSLGRSECQIAKITNLRSDNVKILVVDDETGHRPELWQSYLEVERIPESSLATRWRRGIAQDRQRGNPTWCSWT